MKTKDRTFHPSQFIDIHNHILPGVDDGPVNVQESIALARCYVSQGVRRIIATPHFVPGTAWAASAEKIKVAVKTVNDIFTDNTLPLTVYPGMEIAYHSKLPERLSRKELAPLGHSQYYLLEPSFSDPGDKILYSAKMLLQKGFKLIIAHPERIDSFQKNIEPLIELTKEGLKTQLNIGSLLGKFGTKSRQTADILMKEKGVHYLASDAHNATNRCPPTFQDWILLESELGGELLTQLCVTNPAELLVKRKS